MKHILLIWETQNRSTIVLSHTIHLTLFRTLTFMTDSSPPSGIIFSSTQLQIIESPFNWKLFVSGPMGTGKTTAAVERMRYLLAQGVPGESILMLAAQRSVQEPYLDLLYSPERIAGGEVTSTTMGGGLARRVCDLFWPIAAEAAGFAHPDQPPVFLSLETSQYYMAHIVRPLLDEGYFESVTMDRNRMYSQILDNLNKAAIVGFPHTEIASRLDAAYFGDPAQRRVYADAQECAIRFREYCLQNNLLDFSLQLEIFSTILWPLDVVRNYLIRTYRHLIYDNVEEDSPRAHDIIRTWLPEFESVLLIYDQGGGYRRFLGSDPLTGWALNELCDEQIVLSETDSFVMSENIASLASNLQQIILPDPTRPEPETAGGDAVGIVTSRFYPELLDAVVAETQSLIQGNVAPADIVIISPFLSDALRFSVMNRLEAAGIPTRSHRPSRTLRDEPASQSFLTFSAIAHPQWNIHPPRFDVAYALMQSIEGLDLVRAQLLAEIVYRSRDLRLSSFEEINPEVQERITFLVGNRYSMLREWLLAYREGEELPFDHFLRKLFGEVLSQPGFGFHTDFDSVRVASSLVNSVQHFRQSLESTYIYQDGARFPHLGREYIQMLQDGVIAASYVEGWRTQNKDAVLVAPAHTFLMMNRPVTAQFWLDVGSSGWHQRLAQPLTHPHVLTREWEPGRVWTDADEVETSRAAMARVISGLLHRCRERVYLCMAELGESGFEQRGDLLRAFQRVMNWESNGQETE